MNWTYNTNFPAIDDLRKKAMKKMPRFAFEYLDGGCNEDVNLINNTTSLRKIELMPKYLRDFSESSLKTEIFGQTYDAPFGVAPVGLQGLIWPNAPEILAKAAYKHNLPFVLSTVSTASIERIMEITEGKAWYQLYHPAEEQIKKDVINRAAVAGCDILVILCDVPSFGYRPRDIRNGLAMPPKMSVRNFLQIMGKPEWALKTLLHGTPSFETMKPYMPKGLNMKQLGLYMNRTFSGRLNEDRIAAIRDQWKGHLVLKGVATAEDTEIAIKLGLDGVIVSNHGGRQLDAGQSSIEPMIKLAAKYKSQIKVMMDSGIRSGADVARCLAAGAEFTFLGRTFMYGVGALGNEGGDHTMAILKTQLKQVMDQVGCERIQDFTQHLAES